MALPFLILLTTGLSIALPHHGLCASIGLLTYLAINTMVRRLFSVGIAIMVSGLTEWILTTEHVQNAIGLLRDLNSTTLIFSAVVILAVSSLLYSRRRLHKTMLAGAVIIAGLANTTASLQYYDQKFVEDQALAKSRIENTVKSFSKIEIESCLLKQTVNSYSCLVYSKRYPIKSNDQNLNNILQSFKTIDSGIFVWNQPIQLNEGRYEGKLIHSNHDVVQASLGAFTDDNTIYVILDTETLAQAIDQKNTFETMIAAFMITLLGSLLYSTKESKTSAQAYFIGAVAIISMSIPAAFCAISLVFVIVTIFIGSVYKASATALQ